MPETNAGGPGPDGEGGVINLNEQVPTQPDKSTAADQAGIGATARSEPSPAASASRIDPDVLLSIALGWAMTTVDQVLARPAPRASSAGYLPTDAELTKQESADRYLTRVESGIARLSQRLGTFGKTELEAVQAKATSDDERADDNRGDDKARSLLRALHVGILSRLAAADSRLGKAYALGCGLARMSDQLGVEIAKAARAKRQRLTKRRTGETAAGETCHRSVLQHREALIEVHDSVRDLATVLPPHVGQGVRESVARWVLYLQKRPPRRMVNRSSDFDEVATLRRQIFVWKALLTGEKDGPDSLSASDYLSAGVEALSNLKGETLRALRTVVGPLRIVFPLVILVVGGAAVGVAFWQSQSGAASAGIVSTLTATVLSAWKATKGSVVHAVQDYRTALDGAATDSAIACAITLLPEDADKKGIEEAARSRILLPDAPADRVTEEAPA